MGHKIALTVTPRTPASRDSTLGLLKARSGCGNGKFRVQDQLAEGENAMHTCKPSTKAPKEATVYNKGGRRVLF